MADLKLLIVGNALWYEIDGAVKLIVAKSVFESSYIKETALF